MVGRRSLFLAAALLLVTACWPYPIGPGRVEELLCSFSVNSGGEAPIYGFVSVFEHGLVQIEESLRAAVVSRLTPEQLQSIRSAVTNREFLEETDRLALELRYPTCFDCAAVRVHCLKGGGEYSLEVPTEKVSPTLRLHLERIDAILRQVFGSRYRFRLAEGEWSIH
jgi:hypothetical protein